MSDASLPRVLGIPGAVSLGLGSILGTGIFVSVGVAAGVAAEAVVLAIALAALVATFSGLSSASLAAAHPTSGGTYEYATRFLHPTAGFAAGITFLVAKSASAATAALGFAGYALRFVGVSEPIYRTPLAFVSVVVLTLLVATGLRRSTRVNTVVVATTLAALFAFVAAVLPAASRGFSPGAVLGATAADPMGLLEAMALMFVAYTGYGRVATLGEEIRDPSRNIPIAVGITLVVSLVIYVVVGAAAVFAGGPARLAEATSAAAAPLEVLAREHASPEIAALVAVGAITAMLGVLLNLVLGLSRVVLAMSRRGDAPSGLTKIEERSPKRAVYVVGAAIAGLTLIGDVAVTWAFSAFTVLVYYALTNLTALALPAEQRRVPRVVPALGLVSCAGLAFFVDVQVWATGLGLLAAALLARWVMRRV